MPQSHLRTHSLLKQALFGNPLKALFGNPLKALYGNPLKALYGNPLKALYGNPLKALEPSISGTLFSMSLSLLRFSMLFNPPALNIISPPTGDFSFL